MSKNTKKILIVLVVVVLCIAGAFVLTSGESSAPSDDQHHEQAHKEASEQKSEDTLSSTPSASNEVKIQDYSYQPASITVKVGTKVTWTNQDSVRHDVVDDNDNPDGPSGPLLAKGESYSFTFTKAGTYNYHCTPHPYMKGTVIVTE